MSQPAWRSVAKCLRSCHALGPYVASRLRLSWVRRFPLGSVRAACSMGQKRKPEWYAVKVGRQAGLYRTWDETKAQVHGYKGAVYKSFGSWEEAQQFMGGEGGPTQPHKQQRLEPGSAARSSSCTEGTGLTAAGPVATSGTPAALVAGRLYSLEFAGAVSSEGEAGCGAVVSDAITRSKVGCVSRRLAGRLEGSEAEYQGLVWGLQAAHALGVRHLVVHFASDLLFSQMSGISVVKSDELQLLQAKASALGTQFDDVQVERVDRCAAACELASVALDFGGFAGVQDSKGEMLVGEQQLAAAGAAAGGSAAAGSQPDPPLGLGLGPMTAQQAACGEVAAAAAANGASLGSSGLADGSAVGGEAVADGRPSLVDPAIVYQLEFDGASRGNPGRSGLGALLVESGSGREVGAVCYYVPHATNNMAEYGALLLGLQAAVALGVQRIRVLGDSNLVVEQVMGRMKVSSPVLQQYHAVVLQLRASFKEFRIQHVYREYNKRADALSNEAIDAGGWDGFKAADGHLLPVTPAFDLRQAAAAAMASKRAHAKR